ncbi:MAG: metallophosphoesterase [Eubacteriaceae bacterium]|nr:metallophosphoesterase [Eubacteriaceae bacterium]
MKRKRAFMLLSIIALYLLWCLWANKSIESTHITYYSENFPFSENFRIAHISDLHNEYFGEDNRKLLDIIERNEPDIIAVTGDIVDSSRTDFDCAVKFIEKACRIAPVYYVTGNHEARLSDSEDLMRAFSEAGAVVLRNDKAEITINGEKIYILGIDDPNFFRYDWLDGPDGLIASQIDSLKTESEGFEILLSHRPELFEIYSQCGMDLTLSGHAHGGQIRLPFIGGLYAPNQGFFPQYDSGLYEKGDSAMVVSRGLGNSVLPLRINNRPQVIFIDLESK